VGLGAAASDHVVDSGHPCRRRGTPSPSVRRQACIDAIPLAPGAGPQAESAQAGFACAYFGTFAEGLRPVCIDKALHAAYHRVMRKHTTIDLDQELVREAASVLGTTRTTDTVHAALSDVVRRRHREGLFEVSTDLDLEALDEIRSHRFSERTAPYGDRRDAPQIDDETPKP
jgi:Arc/MetJ family transcription regulator